MSVTLSLSWHIYTNLRSIRSLCLRIARPQWSDLSCLAFFMWMQTCLPSLNSDVVQRCVCVCVFVRMCPDLICCYLHTHHPPLLHAFWPSDLAASQVSQTRPTNESTRLWVNECGATRPHHHPAITRSTNYTANSGLGFFLVCKHVIAAICRVLSCSHQDRQIWESANCISYAQPEVGWSWRFGSPHFDFFLNWP